MIFLEVRFLSVFIKYVLGVWVECNLKILGLFGCNVYLVYLFWVFGVSI